MLAVLQSTAPSCRLHKPIKGAESAMCTNGAPSPPSTEALRSAALRIPCAEPSSGCDGAAFKPFLKMLISDIKRGHLSFQWQR